MTASAPRILQKRRREAGERSAKRRRQEELRLELASTLVLSAGQARGRPLEEVVADVFNFVGILIREPLERRSEEGSPEEQIDGIVFLDGEHYLVEVKVVNVWMSTQCLDICPEALRAGMGARLSDLSWWLHAGGRGGVSDALT